MNTPADRATQPPPAQGPSVTPTLMAPELAVALQICGFALLGIYLANALGQLLPVRILDPAWGRGVVGGLIGSGAFALTGVVFVQLGEVLDPGQAAVERRGRRLRQLCLPVAVGFLLLIPLQTWLELQRLADIAAKGRLELSILKQGDEAIMAARNEAELIEALRNLPGAPPIRDQLAVPFDQIQQQMHAQIAPQIRALRQRQLQERGPLQSEAINRSLVGSAMALCYGVAFLMLSSLGMGLRQRWSAWRQGGAQGGAGRVDPRQFDPRWSQADHAQDGEGDGAVALSRLARLRWALRRAFTPPRPPRPSVQGFDPRWSAEDHAEGDAADTGRPARPRPPRSPRPRPEANPYAAYFNEDDEPERKD